MRPRPPALFPIDSHRRKATQLALGLDPRRAVDATVRSAVVAALARLLLEAAASAESEGRDDAP